MLLREVKARYFDVELVVGLKLLVFTKFLEARNGCAVVSHVNCLAGKLEEEII